MTFVSLSPTSFASTYLEAQEFIAEPNHFSGGQRVLPGEADEGAVRAAQVGQERAAITKLKQGVSARHEFIVGENDVALFAAQHEVTAGEVEHVTAGSCRGELAQPSPGRLERRAEQDYAVLDGGTQGLLDIGQELEAQDLLADQNQVAVRQFHRLADTSVDTVAVLKGCDHVLARAQGDAGMAWGEVRIIEMEIAFTTPNVHLIAGEWVRLAVTAVASHGYQSRPTSLASRRDRGPGCHRRGQGRRGVGAHRSGVAETAAAGVAEVGPHRVLIATSSAEQGRVRHGRQPHGSAAALAEGSALRERPATLETANEHLR